MSQWSQTHSLLETVDAIASSMVSLNAERLEEILVTLESQQLRPRTCNGALTPSDQAALKQRLSRLRTILRESERNLEVLRNLHERALDPATPFLQARPRQRGGS